MPVSGMIVAVSLSVFQDTAGQERYHALGPIYYRDSQGAIIVYDITDEDSFHKVRRGSMTCVFMLAELGGKKVLFYCVYLF